MYRNKVRIISGQWKRRMISFPDQQGLRPTPDRVRETLFNWLGQDLTGRTVLDLFAGSGALGLEAASRYARQVVLVELARPVVQALRDNAAALGADRVEVVNAEGLRYLQGGGPQFDIVLLDPPFDSDLLVRALPLAAARVSDDGVIYAECATIPALPEGWEIHRQDRAGKVHYLLLARTKQE